MRFATGPITCFFERFSDSRSKTTAAKDDMVVKFLRMIVFGQDRLLGQLRGVDSQKGH